MPKKIEFNDQELIALNQIFDVALKAKGLEISNNINYMINKINSVKPEKGIGEKVKEAFKKDDKKETNAEEKK